jgi:hypothetical protein
LTFANQPNPKCFSFPHKHKQTPKTDKKTRIAKNKIPKTESGSGEKKASRKKEIFEKKHQMRPTMKHVSNITHKTIRQGEQHHQVSCYFSIKGITRKRRQRQQKKYS